MVSSQRLRNIEARTEFSVRTSKMFLGSTASVVPAREVDTLSKITWRLDDMSTISERGRTGDVNQVTGIYKSECHGGERTILEGQKFPRCGYCNSDTTWAFIKVREPAKAQSSRQT